MDIIVLSEEIPLWEVSGALIGSGIVVLETTRTHADQIADDIRKALVDDDVGDESGIVHISAEILDNNWTHILFYTDRFSEPDTCIELAEKAVQQWAAAGAPKKFTIQICIRSGSI